MNCTRLVVIALAGLFNSSVFAAACDGFVDVDSTASYCTAVTYVKTRGVTLGCTDTSHYCPSDYVTRAQMALFLQRMGLADSSNAVGDHTDAIGGGIGNSATGGLSYVGGGNDNTASNQWTFIGGGHANTVDASQAVIAGGYNNSVTGLGGDSAIGGGYSNVATGFDSTIPGGAGNTASGSYSFAAGISARSDQSLCAVFSLWSAGGPGLSCLGTANIFRIGSDHGFSVDYSSQRGDGGGTRWLTIGDVFSGQTLATWTGAFLSDGGTWTNASDRAAKEDFVDIDSADVLARVAAMPITRWKYKRDPSVTHLGPVAQDFHAAFGLGSNDISISTVDEEGVALAAIQGLNAKGDARDEVIADLAKQLADLKALVTVLMQKRAADDTSANPPAAAAR